MQTYKRVFKGHFRARSIILRMSSKSNSLSVCPGTVLSVFCLLLYSAGFIRIELKFNDHDQRLVAVEEVTSKLKQGMTKTPNEGTFSLLNPKPFKTRSSLHLIDYNCVNKLDLVRFYSPEKRLEPQTGG